MPPRRRGRQHLRLGDRPAGCLQLGEGLIRGSVGVGRVGSSLPFSSGPKNVSSRFPRTPPNTRPKKTPARAPAVSPTAPLALASVAAAPPRNALPAGKTSRHTNRRSRFLVRLRGLARPPGALAL
jgi:hypothetical protein